MGSGPFSATRIWTPRHKDSYTESGVIKGRRKRKILKRTHTKMQFIVQLFYRYKDSTWELMKILNTCLLYKFIHRKARMVEEGEGSLWIIFIDKRK